MVATATLIIPFPVALRDEGDVLARALERRGGYRVLRELPQAAVFREPDGRPLICVMLLDVETTGLDVLEDEVIEFGALLAEVCPRTGEVFRVVDSYCGFEAPSVPLEPESILVHGIDPASLVGQHLDEAYIEAMRVRATYVVAHNAKFDRPMVERRLPAFSQSAWACSLTEVGWRGEGIPSATLENLLTRAGYYHEGHRALSDCWALLEVLRHPLPLTGDVPMARLLERAREPHFRVWALGLPFDNKERVKKRLHFHWDGLQRCWYGDTDLAGLPRVRARLRELGYNNRDAVQVRIERIDSADKFSARSGRSALRIL